MPAPDILPEEVVNDWYDYRMTPEMQASLIPILADPICELLGLEDWSINYTLADLEAEHGAGHRGRCIAVWTHQNATIQINHGELELGDFVETLFHEHLHLLLAPMEQMGEMEGQMYRVDPASLEFIKNTATFFVERQVAELRTTLGKRLGRMLGVNTHDWLMTLAVRHLEEEHGSNREAEAPCCREQVADPERASGRPEASGETSHASLGYRGRHYHPRAGAGAAAAWHRSGRR